MPPDRASEARADADRSFERLYQRHRSAVYRAALHKLGNVHDAEDVTQAAFVDAYRAILRGSRPTAPRAWLLAIAENVRRRRFRAALRRPREEPLHTEIASSVEPSLEQADALRSALSALPPQQREVFLLREVSGLSYEEIAERVGSTVAAVQMLLFRARQSLRVHLDPPQLARRRRAIGLQVPVWLAHGWRGDALSLTPRGAGAVGAAVLAVTGITAGVVGPHREDPPPPAVVHEQPRPAPAPALAASSVSQQAPERETPVAVASAPAVPAAARSVPAAPSLPAEQAGATTPPLVLTPPPVALPAPPPVDLTVPDVVLPPPPVVVPEPAVDPSAAEAPLATVSALAPKP